ncbi:MAG: TonB-dependent receptor [Salinivirgaceae bacterium]|jgi:outer membrane receptor protein involved in Fe transport|nr:TonB-dependent receptor [Salinivirgaceae bacterium]
MEIRKKFNAVVFLLIVWQYAALSQERLKDTIAIDEVIVTGSKIEVSRKLIPVSVSQISKQNIENTGETNILPTISNYSPGVFVTERNILGFGVSSGGSGAISIRGISGSPNTNVLVLMDGHPQYQGIFGHPLPDAYVASDVEKVEIIRGPASILYGSNAMAGVVNIITKQQQTDGFNTHLEASYGSYNTQKYSGTVGYKKNKLSLFASINHDQTNGIRENTDFKITNGYTKVSYQVNKYLKLTGDINLAKYNANDNGSVYLEEPAPFNIDIARGKTSFSIENSYKTLTGALKLYHNFGTHNLSDGWHSTDRNSGVMVFQTMQLFKGNKLTAGIDAKQYGGKGNSGMAKDSLVTINEIAFYTYMQQTFLQKITISAGLRVENNSNYGNEFVPMVGVNYNPIASTTIKSSISKGFRSPTVMEMYLFAPNPNLEPERMINYEIGWLQSSINKRLNTELTLFTAIGDNLIQTTGQYPNLKRDNIGTFSNKGIEISAKIRASKNIFIHSNYSYLFIEKPVLAAPRQQINISVNYSYKIFNLNISSQHIEKLYISTNPEKTNSYTLLNARLGVQIQKYLNVFILGNNLLNQNYQINYGYLMPKINFLAGIKLKF